MSIKKFSEVTKKALGNYVYCLCSVIDGKRNVFYIGEGLGDRVFDHENNNYSDMTEKGIEISRIVSTGGTIEKYILDCQMENSTKISGQAIAFHAENALINLAKLSDLGIFNSQVGHGFPKRAMTVDEIEAFYVKDTITFDIFNLDDKVMIVRFPFSSQGVFNSVNSEEQIKIKLLSREITTKEDRELPFYICVVYRSIVQKIYKITAELKVVLPQREKGRTRHKIKITSIESTEKYTEFIGSSFGKLTPPHGDTSPIFTYDPISKKEPQ